MMWESHPYLYSCGFLILLPHVQPSEFLDFNSVRIKERNAAFAVPCKLTTLKTKEKMSLYHLFDGRIHCDYRNLFCSSPFFSLLKVWQGQGGSNTAICYRDQDTAPDAIWDSSSHNHGRFICVCGFDPLHNPWSLVRTDSGWPYCKYAMILQHCFYTPIKQNKRSWKTGQVDIMNRRTSDEKSHVLYPGPKLIFLRLSCFQRFLQTMRAIQGSLIVSSSIQIILGYSQLWAICSRYM